MSTIGWLLIGILIGLVVGGAVAWFMGSRTGKAGTVRKMQEENNKFRADVDEHFVQTAELINQLTDSYKKVYDHLSEGAEKLVAPDTVRKRMPQVADQEVRLKRIGASETASKPDDKSVPASERKTEEIPEIQDVAPPTGAKVTIPAEKTEGASVKPPVEKPDEVKAQVDKNSDASSDKPDATKSTTEPEPSAK